MMMSAAAMTKYEFKSLRTLTTIFVLVAAPGCSGRGGPGAASPDGDHPLMGSPAPGFELPLQGSKGSFALSQAAGKVAVVDFWATWCDPCRDSFPAYQQMVDKFSGKLVVIGVSVDDEPDGIDKFASDTGAKFPLVWDKNQSLSKSYQPPTMPTSYILDKSGIVRFVHAGFHSGDEQQIEANLSTLF